MACAVAVMACVRADDRAAKTTTLTAHDAIDIYLAKASRSARDSLTSVLSKRYNITMKAVRDVWNLRTWVWATVPFWTRSDREKFLCKHARFTASLRSDTADPRLTASTDAQGQQSTQTSVQTRPSPWHDRATIAYSVTSHSFPTVQACTTCDVDDWLRQADLHSMPVLHADCISDNGGIWRYEDPFASDVMPMM